jgi:antitoxin Phd
MQTLTANDAKRNLDDDQALELMKADYLKYCFKSAKEDLAKSDVVDGEDFLCDL